VAKGREEFGPAVWNRVTPFDGVEEIFRQALLHDSLFLAFAKALFHHAESIAQFVLGLAEHFRVATQHHPLFVGVSPWLRRASSAISSTMRMTPTTKPILHFRNLRRFGLSREHGTPGRCGFPNGSLPEVIGGPGNATGEVADFRRAREHLEWRIKSDFAGEGE